MKFLNKESNLYEVQLISGTLIVFILLLLLGFAGTRLFSSNGSVNEVNGKDQNTLIEAQKDEDAKASTVKAESFWKGSGSTVIAVFFFAFLLVLTLGAMFVSSDKVKNAIEMLTSLSAIFGVIIGAIPGYYFAKQVNKVEVDTQKENAEKVTIVSSDYKKELEVVKGQLEVIKSNTADTDVIKAANDSLVGIEKTIKKGDETIEEIKSPEIKLKYKASPEPKESPKDPEQSGETAGTAKNKTAATNK